MQFLNQFNNHLFYNQSNVLKCFTEDILDYFKDDNINFSTLVNIPVYCILNQYWW